MPTSSRDKWYTKNYITGKHLHQYILLYAFLTVADALASKWHRLYFCQNIKWILIFLQKCGMLKVINLNPRRNFYETQL